MTIMFDWLRKDKRQRMILQSLREEIDDLKGQLQDFRELTARSLIPLEQLAELTETNLSDLKTWVSFGNLFSKEIDGELYVPGEITLRLLCEKNGSLHLMSRYNKPLIPSDVIKASASYFH